MRAFSSLAPRGAGAPPIGKPGAKTPERHPGVAQGRRGCERLSRLMKRGFSSREEPPAGEAGATSDQASDRNTLTRAASGPRWCGLDLVSRVAASTVLFGKSPTSV